MFSGGLERPQRWEAGGFARSLRGLPCARNACVESEEVAPATSQFRPSDAAKWIGAVILLRCEARWILRLVHRYGFADQSTCVLDSGAT
jgi:hypothetical protein